MDPTRMYCGHTFCYVCIESWANVRPTCPLCKKTLKKRKSEVDLIAQNIIDDLPAKCVN